MFGRGQRWGAGLVAIRAYPLAAGERPDPDPELHLFLAVVVGKRAGGAVVRNRIRRRVREAVRRRLPQVRGDWAVVVLPAAGAAAADFDRLCDTLEQLFRKGKIIA